MTEPNSTNVDQSARLNAKLVEHRQRWIEEHPNIPYGTCLCGCGNPTRLAPKTVKRDGYVKGAPMRYFKRHDLSKSPEPYKVEDRGYKTPCWIWQGAFRPSNGGAYGTKWHDGRLQAAHRVYYEKERGKIPDGLQLHHLCVQAGGGTTLCVNPHHVQPVTAGQNIQLSKVARLTHEQVSEIRRALASGTKQKDLAEQYGVHLDTINRIKRRKTWGN